MVRFNFVKKIDDTCYKLITHNEADRIILNTLIFDASAVPSLFAAIKLNQALVSTLKNLSLSAKSREILGDHGVIPAVVRLFECEEFKTLHANCAGILKNLATNSDRIF